MTLFGVSSVNDPVSISVNPNFQPYRLSSGKVSKEPRLVFGEATLGVIVAGQSNSANYADVLYTATQAKSENLDPFDGSSWGAKDPLLGCSGNQGSWMGRFADKIISSGEFARVVVVPVGVGDSQIASWQTNAINGNSIAAAATRLQNAGLPVSAVLWQQGESDHAASQAAYQTPLQNMIDAFHAKWPSVPWFVGKSTYSWNGSAFVTSANTRAACAAVVNGVDIFAGADTDTLTGPTNRSASGGIHFTASGADSAAQLWVNSVLAGI